MEGQQCCSSIANVECGAELESAQALANLPVLSLLRHNVQHVAQRPPSSQLAPLRAASGAAAAATRKLSRKHWGCQDTGAAALVRGAAEAALSESPRGSAEDCRDLRSARRPRYRPRSRLRAARLQVPSSEEGNAIRLSAGRRAVRSCEATRTRESCANCCTQRRPRLDPNRGDRDQGAGWRCQALLMSFFAMAALPRAYEQACGVKEVPGPATP